MSLFSSFFSTSAPVEPDAPNFHPVSSHFQTSELHGELMPKDTEWLCAGGFVTETQIFYIITDDGRSVMCQVIHSAVGLWYPTIQFTCKIHDPKANKTIWKSINVSNFVTPPPGLDKRSCKADQFSISYKSVPGSEYPESYSVTANLATDLQIFLDVQRPAGIPGWKVGKGEDGGYSYFGPDPKNPEGYVIHRFWPRFISSGHIVSNGQMTPVKGPGMFVHAIQGMRLNLVASRWNFAHFQSDDLGGVSAIQMEFTTIDYYGRKGQGSGGVTVNVGSLVVGGKLAAVTAETRWPDDEQPGNASVASKANHLSCVHDPETGYDKPTEIEFKWFGPSLLKESPGSFSARLVMDVGDVESPKGLIEKVDVLAEIPYVIKMAVNYVAGTKPYIYQWFNPVSLSLSQPNSDSPMDARGHLYAEATFIS